MIKVRALVLNPLILLALLGTGNAFADPWFENTPSLQLSDQIIIGQSTTNLQITIQAKPLTYYKLGRSNKSEIFSNSGEDFEVADGAEIIASGRLNKEGRLTVTLPISAFQDQKVYFQVAGGSTHLYYKLKKFGLASSGLSEIQSVLLVNSLSGPQGIKGDKGDTGAVGPQGPQGERGLDGAVGPQGPKGDTGATGLQGLTGATGPQGIKGDTGAVGPQGLQGERGLDGAIGPQGSKGDVGATGPQGIPGLKGDPGETGLQGLTGATGPQGIKGDKGDTGAVGPQGTQGERGLDGAIGPQGPKGDTGATGLQGIPGLKGDRGETGLQGLTGAIGAQGIKGDKGDRGEAGPQGLTGATGPQGIKGDKGDVGATGPQGIQGIKGDTGALGPQGPQGPAGPQGIPGNPLSCPQGWRDLGPSCMEADFNSTGTIDQAIQECFLQAAFVCEEQELAFACMNDSSMGFTFPDSLFIHSGSVSVRTINSSSFVAYSVYRKVNGLCFGPNAFNSPNATTSYDLYGTVRNYACCMRK